MMQHHIVSRALLCGALALSAVLGTPAFPEPRSGVPSGTEHRSTLIAFHSYDELRQFLSRHRQARPMLDEAVAESPPAPPMAGNNSVVVTAQKAASPGITNNQEAGVDEGDIVKMHGDIMVILRRGRLFTVSLAHGGIIPVDAIDAYAPGVDARADWYDEMLIAGNRIVVIGYSYARGGTEINRFRISEDGRLSFEDSYQLRSNDYYSSRNYASRLIGEKLIFYSPLYVNPWAADPLDSLPALRRWTNEKGEFQPIAAAQHIYVPLLPRNSQMSIEALHTVTTCDLAAPVLSCSAIGVLGPASRSFYVSSHAVYVWVTAWQGGDERNLPSSLVYRLPLDGAAPQAVGARGTPADQFAFREDPPSGALDVLVRSEGAGDAMWNPEFTAGAVALLHIPAQDFGDGGSEVPSWRYRELPPVRGYDFHDRFVGDYVLFGTGNGWGTAASGKGMLVAASIRGDVLAELPLDHGVDRIEPMGRDAAVIGSDGERLTFTAVELTAGREPVIGDRYSMVAAQGETRSHAFFFLPDESAGKSDDGVLGLPIARPGRPAYHQLFESSAAMIFVRRKHRQFNPLGELDAQTDGVSDDDCRASCVDWYGNARPIFVLGRTFALLGYELVEGATRDGVMREVSRVSYAPKPPAQRAPS